jgi:hypothetical protein
MKYIANAWNIEQQRDQLPKQVFSAQCRELAAKMIHPENGAVIEFDTGFQGGHPHEEGTPETPEAAGNLVQVELAGTDFERLPDVQVRVYHDAHLAEAQDCRLREATGVAIPRSALPKRELVRRWQRNMMLNKWLEYCVERGHRFHLPG